MPCRLAVVDDHAIMRDGIRAQLPPDFEVLWEADTGASAIAAAAARPDVALVDADLPDMPGMDVARALAGMGIRAVLLAAGADERTVIEAIRAGACGVVRKHESISELWSALQAAARGDSYLSPVSATALIRSLRANPPPEPIGLTQREMQVLRLIVRGRSSKEIAADLSLELNTVRSYRRDLMAKLDVHNVGALCRRAQQLGLV